MSEKYAIGIDFGTESGRAVVISLADGKEISDHVIPYNHRVIEKKLPHTEVDLGFEWALQHPGDYLEVLERAISKVLKKSNLHADDIVGVGIDFTACTMLPIDSEGQPLVFNPNWEDNPHAWVKLWKHHAAQDKANQLNDIASSRSEEFLLRYGGRTSSEWMLPKIWQILDEAPEVYEATNRFVEAVDWITFQLTGNFIRSSCTAGYKAMWNKQTGYPSNDFLKELDPRLENLVVNKLSGDVVPLGTKVGGITEEMAKRTGLNPGTAIAAGIIDAHASVPALGVVDPGKMVMVMGTSICHMLLSDKEVFVEGVACVVEDGIIPGLYGYEAGQAAGGDIFAWYVENAVPAYAYEQAKKADKTIYSWLETKACMYKPGETGLLALDWWNGNRSVLIDADLSGLIIGMTLQTKPEEIYRTLLESVAFGTRMIINTFEKGGLGIDGLYACGGLSQKNELFMQIVSDVTNRTIHIADSQHTSALGAAMFGAVAAGHKNGGYDSIAAAATKMARVKEVVIQPIPGNVKVYDELFHEYAMLHDYFGRGENNVMKRLKAIRT